MKVFYIFNSQNKNIQITISIRKFRHQNVSTYELHYKHQSRYQDLFYAFIACVVVNARNTIFYFWGHFHAPKTLKLYMRWIWKIKHLVWENFFLIMGTNLTFLFSDQFQTKLYVTFTSDMSLKFNSTQSLNAVVLFKIFNISKYEFHEYI